MATIVVLEDDPYLGDLICHSMIEAGHNAILCTEGSMALYHVEKNDVDLVVADIIIKKNGEPITDGGFSLISRINQSKRMNKTNIPIIAISGMTSYPGLRSALDFTKRIGADAVLSKPFRPHELLRMIDNLLPDHAPEK